MKRKYAPTSCVPIYTEYRHARLLLCLHKSTLTNWFRWNPESRGIKNLYAQIKLVGWCETITQPSQTRWGGRILHRCICADGSTVSSLAEDDKKVGSKNTGRHKANPLALIWCTAHTDLQSLYILGCPATDIHHCRCVLCTHKLNSRAEDWHLCFFTKLRDSFHILWEWFWAHHWVHSFISSTRWSQNYHHSLNKLPSICVSSSHKHLSAMGPVTLEIGSSAGCHGSPNWFKLI